MRCRPVALENDEKRDFVFKDSLSKVMRDSVRIKSAALIHCGKIKSRLL